MSVRRHRAREVSECAAHSTTTTWHTHPTIRATYVRPDSASGLSRVHSMGAGVARRMATHEAFEARTHCTRPGRRRIGRQPGQGPSDVGRIERSPSGA